MSRNSICHCGSGKRFKHCHGKHSSNSNNLVLPFATRFDQLSLSSCYLELLANNHVIGSATGFFWRQSNDVYLVTNWHVVTNKDVFTSKDLQGVTCPNLIRVYASRRSIGSFSDRLLLGENPRASIQLPIDIPVYEDFEKPLWFQHRDWETKRIDVVVFKLSDSLDEQTKKDLFCINDYTFRELMHLVGGELFIIGYPLKEDAGFHLPIWKNGTIATELMSAWKTRPAFLIDGNTSKGMSGSPVVRRVYGPAADKDMHVSLDAIVTSEFLGIYSGRLSDSDSEQVPTIGIVWWRSVIDEIIAQPSPGDRGL
jgi:hypothetical protein